MLGARSTRYDKIGQILAKPAYQARNSKFVVKTTTKAKEVLRDEQNEATETKPEDQSGSLF